MAETAHRRLAAIMFTDMVGYSALTQKNEALALELLEVHHKLLRRIFPAYGGKEIKTIGDAFLVEFSSALEATRCAIEVQKTLVQHNAVAPPKKRIQIRIGIHIGDVVHEDNDVLGDGVNIASRIEPLAHSGGICVSEDVVRQIRNKVEEPVVRIGSLRDGKVTIFIPPHRTDRPEGAMGEGTAIDAAGNLYTAEATVRGVSKYVKE